MIADVRDDATDAGECEALAGVGSGAAIAGLEMATREGRGVRLDHVAVAVGGIAVDQAAAR